MDAVLCTSFIRKLLKSFGSSSENWRFSLLLEMRDAAIQRFKIPFLYRYLGSGIVKTNTDLI